jgi:hypothetical protein
MFLFFSFFNTDDNTDLKSFSNACGVTATVDATIGGNNEKICEAGGCVEALLDIEYIEAVANPIPLTVLYLSTCKSHCKTTFYVGSNSYFYFAKQTLS